jgi:hypothetical protein
MAAKATRFNIVRTSKERKIANDSRGCVEIVTSTPRPRWRVPA